MSTLQDLLNTPAFDMTKVREHLDKLSPAERLSETRTLGRKEQSRLFDAAQGFKAITLDDIVPPGTAAMKSVWHHGRNTLPAFNYFAKVFCRPDTANAQSELWGYNSSGGFVNTVVGPGYFTARIDKPSEVLVDYLLTPPRRPSDWPEILPIKSRLSRFVYYRMQDVLRGVSNHVTIGRATREGKDMSAWFVLCREGA